ncbi:MAG: DUF362 domain-containing protein [Rhodospirillales bacterium]
MSRPVICRRTLIASAGCVSLAGCSRLPAGPKPRVSILRAADYSQEIYDTVRRAISGHNLDVRGKRVVLKPNLVEFDPKAPINTHPVVVHAAFEAFRAMGAEVRIAEGPGHRRDTLDLADAAGYFKIIPQFERHFTDLNLDEVSEVRLVRSVSRLDSLYLPHTVLGADLLVSMPKLKTHHWAAATLSMKNLFGVVPGAVYGWPKNVLHWAGIDESIADLHRAIPRKFAIVDGVIGMEGNGPIQGSSRLAGVIVAGDDPAAVDATCCRIMGIDPLKVRYLDFVARGRLGEENISQIAEPLASVKTRFDLLPVFASVRL